MADESALEAPATAEPPSTTEAPEPTSNTSNLLTAAFIESQQQELLDAAADDESTRTKLADILSAALSHINRRDDFLARSTDNQTITNAVANEVESLKAQLAALAKSEPQAPATADLSELELLETQLNAQVAKTKADIDELQNKIGARTARGSTIRERIAAVENELAAMKTAAATIATGEKPMIAKARQLETLAKRQMLEAERPALLSDLARMDAREAAGATTLELDVMTKKLLVATEETKLATKAAQRARTTVAQDVADKARQNALSVNPLLLEFAENNSQIAESNRGLAAKVADAESKRKSATLQLDKLTAEYRSIRNKVDTIGLPASVGAILRKQRISLPQVTQLKSEITERQSKIDGLQLDLIDVTEERLALSDAEGFAERIVDEIAATSPLPQGTSRDALIEEAVSLANQRRDVLDPYKRSLNALFDALADTSVTQQSICDQTDSFADYIDELVLWIRSAEPVSLNATIDFEGGLRWTKPAPWKKAIRGLLEDAKRSRVTYTAGALMCFLSLIVGWPAATRLNVLGKVASKSTCQSFLPTARATFLSFVMALRVAAPLVFVAWRLQKIATGTDFSSLSKALYYSGIVALCLEFSRQVVRPGGLSESHLEWTDRTVRSLRKQLQWLSPLATLLVFLSVLLIGDDNLQGPGNIERLCFLFVCGLSSLFFYRVMHPRTGIPASYLANHPGGWIDRLQFFWFWSLVAMPLFIGLLSAGGYVYTANQIAWRLFVTIMLISFSVFLVALISRAILVVRRATYIKEARHRHAEAAKRAEAEEGQPTAPAAAAKSLVAEVAQNNDPLADLRAQTVQARRLTAALVMIATVGATWIVWHDIVPALGFLENWPMWTSTQTVTEIVKSGDGIEELQTREIPDPVTIAELLLSLLVLGLSFVAARDIPGVAEITILNRLPLEKSVRYAITTLISYGLVLAGVIVACKIIGLRWSQIQWMATALTFGLAFGLQEMFANFVAGIIILFERPVRVGDIVTLDGVSGVVSRVRIRATTITNWDRQDFIVPNKDFITGRVLNWTLSDDVNRIMINVGVAYGSDTKKTEQLLREAADAHPVIVKEPSPVVTFEEFGDSSLKFVLRCYIAIVDMPSRLQVIHDLHISIDESFRKAGIVIAFPQQDIHVHSADGGFPAMHGYLSPSRSGQPNVGTSQGITADAKFSSGK